MLTVTKFELVMSFILTDLNFKLGEFYWNWHRKLNISLFCSQNLGCLSNKQKQKWTDSEKAFWVTFFFFVRGLVKHCEVKFEPDKTPSGFNFTLPSLNLTQSSSNLSSGLLIWLTTHFWTILRRCCFDFLTCYPAFHPFRKAHFLQHRMLFFLIYIAQARSVDFFFFFFLFGNPYLDFLAGVIITNEGMHEDIRFVFMWRSNFLVKSPPPGMGNNWTVLSRPALFNV